MIREIEELPVKISCIERSREQRSKHVIVLEVGGHSWILDGELMGGKPRSNIMEKKKTEAGMCVHTEVMQYANNLLFQSARSTRWVGVHRISESVSGVTNF